MPALLELKSDSEGAHQPRIAANCLEQLRGEYESLSEWLHALEVCPDCFRLWDSIFPGYPQTWLRQWISDDRPQLPWPEPGCSVRLGSGTSGMVAIENGRQAILCELNPEYGDLIESRTNVTPGFNF